MTKPSKVRMAEDATGKRTTYEEIEVGKDLGSFEWTVTEADIERQCLLDEHWHGGLSVIHHGVER